MQKSIMNGLLCRGGLTFGEIIETNENHILGRFIVGQAVTDAAHLEEIAKGSRVLINQNLPHSIWIENSENGDRISPLFSPFTNPLDYQVYDEFKWYLVPFNVLPEKDIRILTKNERIEYTKQRLLLANMVRLSPWFNWNTKNDPGKIQLIATTRFIAENNLLDVFHDFEWTDIGTQRSNEIVQNIENIIQNSNDFKIVDTDHRNGVESFELGF